MRWLAILFGVWVQLFANVASAQDLITERAWLEDSTGQLQWPQVQTMKTSPYDGVLSRGFGASVVWVRLKIAGSKPTTGPVQDNLVLRIRPVYLDDIQVFDSAANGLADVTGDTHHPEQSSLKSMAFLVPLAATEQPRNIWLRLNSTSTRQISATVVRESDLLNLEQTQHLLFALYVCLVTIFSLWGITHWLFTKEKLAGLFGVKQLAALVYALCALGYMRIFWPQTWSAHTLDLLSSIFSMVATSAGIYFHLVFLREFKPRPWTVWPLRVLAGMLPVNLGLFFVLDMPRLALQINLSTVLITPFVALLMAVLARGWETKDPRQQPALPRPVVIGFYSLLLILLAAASLPGLGLTKGAEIAIYLVQAHGLASGFLVLLMLQYRARFIQKQQQQAQQQLDRLQLQAEQDRHARHEQEQLLTMLTHELKTPLATMHMRLDAHTKGAPEIKRAIRDMNAIIERCLQSARLGDQGLQIHPSDFDVSALLHDAVSSCPAPERIQLIRSTPLLLKSDQQLLFIVISNLLENACKYSAPETPIRVEALPATPTTPQLQLVISNTVGRAGWPDKDKLFSKYYRTPGAQRQAGTGLGLFLVRNLLHKLGGQVYFAPQGEEVRFVVLLPSVDAS